jgi:hypothetical protein
MNADGTRPVTATVSAGLSAPALQQVWTGLFLPWDRRHAHPDRPGDVSVAGDRRSGAQPARSGRFRTQPMITPSH